MKKVSSLFCVFVLLLVGVCNAETKTEYWPNGKKKSETNYVDGKKHGIETVWDEKGQKRRETYWKDDKQHGLQTTWHENGNMSTKMDFKNHLLVSASRWKPNGNECSHTNVKGGRGVVVTYHNNGQKQSETTFKDGRLHGLYTEWDEDGNVTYKERYENHKMVEKIK
jgi:antitoxin component YwqK of YwqJK toxin-antitoxin module